MSIEHRNTRYSGIDKILLGNIPNSNPPQPAKNKNTAYACLSWDESKYQNLEWMGYYGIDKISLGVTPKSESPQLSNIRD
jgi:hypothetical protein